MYFLLADVRKFLRKREESVPAFIQLLAPEGKQKHEERKQLIMKNNSNHCMFLAMYMYCEIIFIHGGPIFPDYQNFAGSLTHIFVKGKKVRCSLLYYMFMGM